MFDDMNPEEARLTFINNCIAFDTPRLETEKYPEAIDVVSDVAYTTLPGLTLDYYVPAGKEINEFDEAFLLIHGGAFVYGNKELDKCFGMHLCEATNIPVVNVNYTLLPESTIDIILREIMMAVDFVETRTGIDKFHTIGDSAGGYLAVMSAVCINSGKVREDLKIEYKGVAKAVTMHPICGCYVIDDGFPGTFFEKGVRQLPDYVYNLEEAVKLIKPIPTTVVTGENDFLREENRACYKVLTKMGFDVKFHDFDAVDGRDMHHVFPISDPTWEESRIYIDTVCEVVNKGKN